MEEDIFLFHEDGNDQDLVNEMATNNIDLDRKNSLQLHQMLRKSEDATAATLVHNIASFLTFSDAASFASFVPSSSVRVVYNDNEDDDDGSESTPADSWAVGVEFDGSTWSVDTPPTPAVIAISPGATPNVVDERMTDKNKSSNRLCEASNAFDDNLFFSDVLRERRRRWAQEKITTAVFAHPKPLRSYCVNAFSAAMNIKHQKDILLYDNYIDPEEYREPFDFCQIKRRKSLPEAGLEKLNKLLEVFFRNVPLSIFFDVVEGIGGVGLETTVASFQLSLTALSNIISAIGRTTQLIWRAMSSFNPLHLLEAIISLQFNAMGKTSEVLASGIQSVATGVGSASSMALYRLSAANLSASRLESSSSLAANGHIRPRRTFSNEFATTKLLKKLSVINDAARVVSYRETEDDTGGLTRQAVCRTRRMMHYTVPLRPFVATVAISSYIDTYDDEPEKPRLPFEDSSANLSMDSACTPSVDEDDSPFMCTPQSFPPTPHSRQLVIAQRSQFSDDVVFIARDRLRIHDGLKSEDERTRERSRALEVEKRLAVFACKDLSCGIDLSCGRHIATKVGHMYYASTRSMIPILRSCFVYFEFTVLPQTVHNSMIPGHAATLAIGLSTEEMPPNTLVGAWQGSVGLCTTGQILMAGEWCSPANPLMSAYVAGSTVGCLVYLDDESAFETWDGVMVKAAVRFNVNGVTVAQPVSTLPMTGSPAMQPSVVPSHPHMTGGRELSGATMAALDPTRSTALNILVPAIEDLYPTVTIQSSGTPVVCRFSTEDIAANSRVSMGALDGVAVYAVDGSVIFRADE